MPFFRPASFGGFCNGAPEPPSPDGFIVSESGDFILNEDGSGGKLKAEGLI